MTDNKELLIKWAKAAGIRALKTAAQAAVALLPTTAVALGEINWGIVLSTAVVAAITSMLTSVGGIPEVADGESPLIG
ncbi:membrane protein [Denitrobacterium detoxificans]|uniref:Holin, r1t family n=1 Tax=Denitrobacterium detoxificans TaxID=79604 RepID=A0A172RXF4_9ACTN|nr:holin [Denitrobacterium detoxificans]ANE22408.1 membrane protein [Denitrobacterium detoxificans]SEP00931.1 holin, r1t family [Denitrobacterium detoxificans]